MAARYPDGIKAHHTGAGTSRWRHAHWIALLALGALMALAISGVLGGGRNSSHAATGGGATLRMEAPTILRSGEFFEMEIEIEANRAIAEPAIAIAAPYWRNLTINSMYPQPTEEAGTGGAFSFSYDRLEPGDLLTVKIDGQVNPTLLGGNRGWIELRDGDARLLRVPLSLKVLP